MGGWTRMDTDVLRFDPSQRNGPCPVHHDRTSDAAPDTVVEFDLTLQAQNDTSRLDVKTIPYRHPW